MFLFLIASGLAHLGVLRVPQLRPRYLLLEPGAYRSSSGSRAGALWLAAVLAALDRRAGRARRALLFQRLMARTSCTSLSSLTRSSSSWATRRIIWGAQQSQSRPPGLTGALLFGATILLQPAHLLLGPAIALGFWFALQRTRAGRFIRAAALDRETLGALGVNVRALYTGVFVLASFLGGLGGALITPMRAIVPGMDTEVIVEAFVVVVIGGLGSFWGTFLGALIYGQVLSFGILFFPRFSIFSIFALMAAVLIIRPWGLLGRPLK